MSEFLIHTDVPEQEPATPFDALESLRSAITGVTTSILADLYPEEVKASKA